MARIVIVGGGPAGGALALFAARRGHEAVVVDRDPGPPEGDGDAAASWPRRGVAQAHFAHGWPARSARILRREVPDVLEALHAAGVGTTDQRFGPGYEDERSLTGRRPVLEAALRGCVQREPGVTLLEGSVTGLVRAGRSARIVGARLADGTQLDGDLVVDAAGRRSASDRWLRDLGLAEPTREDHPCGLYYFSRHYRLRDGAAYPERHPVFESHPYLNLFTFVQDDDTFSIAAAMSARDPLRRRLRDPATYDRFLHASPTMGPWLSRAEPIGPVHVMAGLSNRRRRPDGDGRSPAPGLVLLGDAALYTNPTLGQGVSLGLWMASRLSDLLERAVHDPSAAAVSYEAWIDEELGPRFVRQVAADRRMRRQLEAGVDGAGFLPPDDEEARYLAAVWQLAMAEEDVRDVVSRVTNLLDPPAALHEPSIAARARRLLDGPPPDPPVPTIPRTAFAELVGAA